MPKIHTLTNPAKPGEMMGAESKRLLTIVHQHPNSSTQQLAQLWGTLPPLPNTTGPTASTSARDTQMWVSLRISRLKGLRHVLNNGLPGSGSGLWHITPRGMQAIGLLSADDSTTPTRTKPLTPQQIEHLLARRGSKLHLPNTPPASPFALATPRNNAHQPWPEAKPTRPLKPEEMSPREREIAMFAGIKSRVGNKEVDYTGIKSQLGLSKARNSLYGPNSTVR